jgi:hypothetical protein
VRLGRGRFQGSMGVFIGEEIPIVRGIHGKKSYKWGVYSNRMASIESNACIFFVLRQSHRVEPGRAFTHHASVPFTEGGWRTKPPQRIRGERHINSNSLWIRARALTPNRSSLASSYKNTLLECFYKKNLRFFYPRDSVLWEVRGVMGFGPIMGGPRS